LLVAAERKRIKLF